MKRVIFGTVVGFILATALLRWQSQATPEKKELAHFSFVITHTREGWEMESKTGCGWEKLSYSCGDRTPCRSLVDEHGVKGLP